jgi:hypothetical protein
VMVGSGYHLLAYGVVGIIESHLAIGALAALAYTLLSCSASNTRSTPISKVTATSAAPSSCGTQPF